MARVAAMEMGGRGGDGSMYEWEEKRNDDLWVMELLGNRMLHQAGPKACAKAQDQGQAPAVVWRQKCKCEGFDPGTYCLCKRYDPVLMLPFSLFSEHEVHREVYQAAMQLLEDAQGTIPGGFQKSDMEMDVSEQVCHLTELRCRAVCFRVRKRTRHLFIEGARSRAVERDQQGLEGEAAALRLDRFEFEANMYLLNELVNWCGQYRIVKTHTVSQQRFHAQKRHEALVEEEMRRSDMDTRLRRMSMTGMPDNPAAAEGEQQLALPAWGGTVDSKAMHASLSTLGGTADAKALALVPRPDTAKSNDSQATRQTLARTGTPATGKGVTAAQAVIHLTTKGQGPCPDAPGKPMLCCRCGHSGVWHEEPEASRTQAPAVAPWLQKGKYGRRTSVAYARPSTPPGQSAVIVGGVLRKAGSMVSLQKL